MTIDFTNATQFISGLNLSPRTIDCIKEATEEQESIENYIVKALHLATVTDIGRKVRVDAAMTELANALRSAGYSYAPADARELLLREVTNTRLSDYYFRDLPEYTTPYHALDTIDTLNAESYSTLTQLTEKQRADGMKLVKEILRKKNEERFLVLCLRYGLDENGYYVGRKTYQEIAAILGKSAGYAHQLHDKAIRTLRSNIAHIAEYALSSPEIEYVRNALNHERRILEKVAEVKRYRALMNSLEKVNKPVSEDTEIGELDLTLRTFNALKIAGYDTLGDILANIEKIPTIRGIAENGFLDIQRALRKLGYII